MTQVGALPAVITTLRFLLSLLLASCVTAVGIGLASPGPSENPPLVRPKTPALPQKIGKKAEGVDALGDPLPPGALLRLGSIRLKHGIPLNNAVFSADGKLLASGGRDRVICIWDSEFGKELRQILGPEGGVSQIVFTPDNKQLIGAAYDGHIYLWEVSTGKIVRQFVCCGVKCIALSPSGHHLVATSYDWIWLWELGSGKELWTVQQKSCIFGVAFSPDGQTIASSAFTVATTPNMPDNLTAQIRDVKSGKLLRQVPCEEWIGGITFSRDGKFLLASTYREVHCWELATGKKRQGFFGKNCGDCGGGVVFSRDGKWLAMGDNRNRIRLWNWDTGKEERVICQHSEMVKSFAFSPDGKTLVSVASFSAVIYLWDVATGQPKIALPGHQERLSSVVYFPNGRTVVSGAWDGTVRLWDAKTGRELRRFAAHPDKTLRNHLNSEVIQVVVAPDGKQVGAVRCDDTVLIWDAATGKEIRRFRATTVVFSPDGKWLACSERGTGNDEWSQVLIRLHDRVTGKELLTLRGHLTEVYAMAFTPDSKTLIARGIGSPHSQKRFVQVWDVATGKNRQPRPEGYDFHNNINLSPDGRTLANITHYTITFWETTTKSQRGTLEGHKDMVCAVAFSPDGRTVASASMDGTVVHLWDPHTGKEIGCLEGHRGWVLTIAFSPDGKTLISGGMDTTALIWDVSRFTQRPAQVGVPTAAELEKAFADLASDALVAYRAIGKLTATPGPTLALLHARLKPAVAVEAKRIAQWIGDLGSKQFKVRDLATRELDKLGEHAVLALEKALTTPLPLESKRRLEALLEKLNAVPLSAETLRQVRAVEVLEAIGTPEARAVLESLASGAFEVRQTREARGALDRWKSR